MGKERDMYSDQDMGGEADEREAERKTGKQTREQGRKWVR